MASITCFSTDDLKNWTDHGVVFRATNTSWASLTWAPSAISNQSKVFLYFANGAGSIGVATSSVPTGPFVDARGSALINSATPGAATATQWYFDPCGFIDTDGLVYLYFGGQYPTNARVIQLNANLTSVSGSAAPMFATNFFEASHLHKRNGIYYYTYCNRFEVGAAIYCETNSNPTNGFVPQGTVLANPPQNVNNNNHHSIVSYLGNWYIAYHNRAAALANGLSNSDAVYKRSLCLDALNYNVDGSIQQVTSTTDGLAQLKHLNPYTRVEAETIAKQSGVKTEGCSEGGLNVTSVTNGSWIRIRGVNFGSGAATFFARVASAGSGGNIELRLDSLAGTRIGTCAVAPTGGWQTWTTASCSVTNASGARDLYLKFTGDAGDLLNFNWWQFQAGGASSQGLSVTLEAEAGTLGANWAVSNSSSPAYITITNTGAGGNPGSAARVATYNVSFPAAGVYELYARIRVGPDTFNDDSLFYGNGFGAKSPTADGDWILVNGLAAAGFTAAGDEVAGVGSVGSQVWKWVNLSQMTNGGGSENPITFTVPADNFTQTFQIGAREDGLWIDKFVFGPAGYQFTVANLDTGSPGTFPTPIATIDPTKFYQTIEGFGGAIAFYNGWVKAHPFKNEIYTNAFAGLNLSMLRLGNWFRYQGTANFDPDAPELCRARQSDFGSPGAGPHEFMGAAGLSQEQWRGRQWRHTALHQRRICLRRVRAILV
jgi:arabinoxylan arabinofuranohydrolase